MAGRATGPVAVVAPGGGYGTDGPLLMFSAVAAQRRGATVRGDVMTAVERFLDDVAGPLR